MRTCGQPNPHEAPQLHGIIPGPTGTAEGPEEKEIAAPAGNKEIKLHLVYQT
jgi:hypothetical protein